jgi:hypothetical protein
MSVVTQVTSSFSAIEKNTSVIYKSLSQTVLSSLVIFLWVRPEPNHKHWSKLERPAREIYLPTYYEHFITLGPVYLSVHQSHYINIYSVDRRLVRVMYSWFYVRSFSDEETSCYNVFTRSRSTTWSSGFRRSTVTPARTSTSCSSATSAIWPQRRLSTIRLRRWGHDDLLLNFNVLREASPRLSFLSFLLPPTHSFGPILWLKVHIMSVLGPCFSRVT